jgi:hypothetical protein
MTFEFRIPPIHLPIIKKIFNLTENQKKIIYTKFKTYKPLKFDEKIQPIEEIKDFPEIFDIIVVIYRLYHELLEDQIIEDIDDFTIQLSNDFIKQIKSEIIEDFDTKIDSFKQFFKELVTLDTPVFYFQKAINLLRERSKLILKTRIISDIRPIFKEETIDSPNYCLITHNLRIQYSKETKFNPKRVFFALDHQDLINLQKQIERALEKEEELKKLCQKVGLEIFEV